ncbi:MAG: MG2 domain-containing protein, partial [Myxococcota bacterium]
MRRCPSLLAALALACSNNVPPASVGDTAQDTASFERAGPPTPRLSSTSLEGFDDVGPLIEAHFDRFGTGRVHVQLDRPLYRPGETVWLKTWSVRTAGFAPSAYPWLSVELVNPRGQTVETKQIAQAAGAGTNDFVIPADAPGGKWTLRARDPSGWTDERPFIVSSYQPPRIQKELEFAREAYGPGDTVQALVELRKGTGEPLADHDVRVLLQVDGRPVAETTLTTGAEGAVMATGTLPERLTSGDGLLTVLVEEGGVTESISRAVPIVLADAQLAFFPEGGDLVAGIPGRVYLESANRHGEPADVEGHVTDDTGRRVASFRTLHDGFGRFGFTPEPGR